MKEKIENAVLVLDKCMGLNNLSGEQYQIKQESDRVTLVVRDYHALGFNQKSTVNSVAIQLRTQYGFNLNQTTEVSGEQHFCFS